MRFRLWSKTSKTWKPTWRSLPHAPIWPARAEELGYNDVALGEGLYVQVEGYDGRPTAELAEVVTPTGSTQQQLPKEFTQSLVEWMQDLIYQLSLQTGATVEGSAP